MDFFQVLAGLLGRDAMRARRLRSHVRGEAADSVTSALTTVEDVVVAGYGAAAKRAERRIDAGDADGAASELAKWARAAQPQLQHVRADLERVAAVAPDLRRPGSAVLLVDEMVTAVVDYLAAVDAFLGRDLESGFASILSGHRSWKRMQERNGLAKYG